VIPPEGDSKRVIDVQEIWPNEGRAWSSIAVRETATAKVARTFPTHPCRFAENPMISSDGQWLVANVEGNTGLLVWDLAKGEQLRLSDNTFHEIAVIYINSVNPAPNPVVSGNGILVAVVRLPVDGRWNLKARVWDLAKRKYLREFPVDGAKEPGVPEEYLTTMSISRDGKTLATGVARVPYDKLRDWDKKSPPTPAVRLWDLTSGKQIRALGPHERVPDNFLGPRDAHTADGKRHISPDYDHNLRVVDSASGKELCRLVSFANGSWVVFDPQGRYDAANGGRIEGLRWTVGIASRPLSQFRECFYDPGLLAKHLGLSKEPLRKLDGR
jgi:WD40 repeat protein